MTAPRRGTPRLTAHLRLPTGDLELSLAAGQGRLLDGPAGASAVAALTGLPTGGAAPGRGHVILLDGRRLDRRSPAARVRCGLGMLVGAPLAPGVSVADHLAAATGPRRAAALLDGAPLLRGRGADPAGVLSGGERSVLAWLRCAATDPRAVVLDAPGAGLDHATLEWAGERVAAWLEAGVAVLMRSTRPETRRWLGP